MSDLADFEPFLSRCDRCAKWENGEWMKAEHETVIASEADKMGAVVYMLDGWLDLWCYQAMPKWLMPRYHDLDALRLLAEGKHPGDLPFAQDKDTEEEER
jgi:hypothetical protein